MKYIKMFEYNSTNEQLINEISKKFQIKNSTHKNALTLLSEETLNNLNNIDSSHVSIMSKTILKTFLELALHNNIVLDASSSKMIIMYKNHHSKYIIDSITELQIKDAEIYNTRGNKMFDTRIIYIDIESTYNYDNNINVVLLSTYTTYEFINGKYILDPKNSNIRDICKKLDNSIIIDIIKNNDITSDNKKSLRCIQKSIDTNDYELLKTIIDYKFYPNENYIDNDVDNDMLMYALNNSDNVEIITLLINLYEFTSIDIKDFSIQVNHNNVNITKLLLDKIKVNYPTTYAKGYSSNTQNPFITAFSNDNKEMFKLLINSTKLNVSYDNNRIVKDLYDSNNKKCLPYIQLLLESPNFNQSDYNNAAFANVFSYNYTSDVADIFNLLINDKSIVSTINNDTMSQIINNSILKKYGYSTIVINDDKYRLIRQIVLIKPDLDYSYNENVLYITASTNNDMDIVKLLLNNIYVLAEVSDMHLYKLYEDDKTKHIVQFLLDRFKVQNVETLLMVASTIEKP